MAPDSIFPMRSAVETDTAPETVALSEAGDVVEALTCDTARALIARIHDDPAPASDLATDLDTTLQNVHYHLDRLQDAGLIEVVDTWYSERGKDMPVYGPANDPLVIVAGQPADKAEVREAVAEAHATPGRPGGPAGTDPDYQLTDD